MKYFEIKINPDMPQHLKITNILWEKYNPRLAEDKVEKIDSLVVGYFENNQFLQFYELIFNPQFLISDELRKLFKLYDEDIKFKGIQLYSEDEEDEKSFLYWWAYLPFLECLSKKSEKYPNNMIKKLVLDKKKIEDKHIFRVADILENKIIISLAVVESLLRRGITGFKVEEVEVY